MRAPLIRSEIDVEWRGRRHGFSRAPLFVQCSACGRVAAPFVLRRNGAAARTAARSATGAAGHKGAGGREEDTNR